MSCININSQEYKDILNEVGDPFDAYIEFIKRYGIKNKINQELIEPLKFEIISDFSDNQPVLKFSDVMSERSKTNVNVKQNQ